MSSNVGGPQGPGFETYIESWDSNYQSVINGMPMQNGMTVRYRL